MSTQIYSKAPIIEAIIDVHVVMPSDFSKKSLIQLENSLKAEFPLSTPMTTFQFAINASDEQEKEGITSSREEVGIRLSNSDNSRILQLRNSGFAYSHMPPYGDWENYSREAKRNWDMFVEICKPISVTRCAIRYINRIDIDETPVNIEEYLNIYPAFPKEKISQTVTGMQLQLQMPQEDINAMAIINEGAVPHPTSPTGISILLDIDVFGQFTMTTADDSVWEYLNILRSRKNLLFEAFITDKTREMIK